MSQRSQLTKLGTWGIISRSNKGKEHMSKYLKPLDFHKVRFLAFGTVFFCTENAEQILKQSCRPASLPIKIDI